MLKDAQGNSLIPGRWYVEEIDGTPENPQFGSFWFWTGAEFVGEGDEDNGINPENHISGKGASGVMHLQNGKVAKGYETIESL